jgi:DNA-binding LacI/PurR family transcriptional regulator
MDSSILSTVAKRPTIMDVARRCGLSKTTVSVILNDSPASSRVPPDTQQRVRDAAIQLGYSPNWRARALASRRTHMIGILYTPPMPLIVRGNYEGIIAGINEVLHENHYHMLYVPLGEDPSDWRSILLDQRLDGALVLSRLRDPLAQIINQAKLPIALVNADSEMAVPTVIVDDYDGALQITRHLIELGHRRITFLLGQQPSHYSVTQRQDGYAAAMRDAGLEQHARVNKSSLDEFVASLASDPQRPTAVVAYTHYMAVKLLQKLWERGLKVPDDLSVATFTNAFPVEDVIPPLTTVGLPTEQMGRTAAEMVLEQIRTDGTAPRRRVVLKETLIVRKSTAAPNGAD